MYVLVDHLAYSAKFLLFNNPRWINLFLKSAFCKLIYLNLASQN